MIEGIIISGGGGVGDTIFEQVPNISVILAIIRPSPEARAFFAFPAVIISPTIQSFGQLPGPHI